MRCSPPPCFPSILALLVAGILAAPASSQCSTPWLPGEGFPSTNGSIYAMTMWDADGSGPMPPVLVVGGSFTIAGRVLANNIATYDPVSDVWSALGSGVSGSPSSNPVQVNALTTLPNGDLVVGGAFTAAGGVPALLVARWNGTSWSALGSGLSGGHYPGYDGVFALTTLPNGDLVVGGNFSSAGGVGANNIARWNGTSWSGLSSGMNDSVFALTTRPNGDLVAGGRYTVAGGVSANRIARWDGTSWSALGSGLNLLGVSALTTLPTGDVVAAGDFTTAGGVSANSIARWDGTSWWALGSGMSFTFFGLRTLATLANGDLVAGGQFTVAGGVSAKCIARWNGLNWSALGPGRDQAVDALTTLPNGNLVAAGGVGPSANYLARWDGMSWSNLAPGIDNSVFALKTLPNGDLIAGGRFTWVGGVQANGVARWNGTSWSALGSGVVGFVNALTALPNGHIVVGGWLLAVGGVNTGSIARWDGTSWSALGAGISSTAVGALTTLANGNLVAGGTFNVAGGVSANNIARWNGSSWSSLGSGTNGGVSALTTMPNGDLVAGGTFTTAGGMSANNIARWNGSSWSALGSGMFLPPTPYGPFPSVGALAVLPNGDLMAGGLFTTAGTVTANGIGRWDGTNWSAFGSGTNGAVSALTTLSNGDLMAGGNFTFVNGALSAWLARMTTTCPATTVSYGSGCTGSGGSHVLTAASLPWTGSTFRSVATGMPSNALAIGVRGLSTTSILLTSILTQAVAGCTLRVNPDVLDLYVPTAGSVETQFAIPNTVALAGQVFHQQLVPVELDSLGNIIALTSTNRLTVTIGAF